MKFSIGLKDKTILSKKSFMSNEQLTFWKALSAKEINKISNIVLQKPHTSLNQLDKYSVKELNFILKMFPLETINKKIKQNINYLSKFYIYNIIDYKIYDINLQLSKNLKRYKKYRIKQEKQMENNKNEK